jgi:hypothetical protein
MDALLVLAVDINTKPYDYLSPRGYIVLMGLGFLIGTFGHIIRAKAVVAAGITLIFLATVLLPLSAHFSH